MVFNQLLKPTQPSEQLHRTGPTEKKDRYSCSLDTYLVTDTY